MYISNKLVFSSPIPLPTPIPTYNRPNEIHDNHGNYNIIFINPIYRVYDEKEDPKHNTNKFSK